MKLLILIPSVVAVALWVATPFSASAAPPSAGSLGSPSASARHTPDKLTSPSRGQGSTAPVVKNGGTDVNGTEASLNRGIEDKAGWKPPHMRVEELHTISLDAFCRKFPPAAKYKRFFKAAAQKYRVNSTLLAAIAMEESHCDPGVSDGGNAANAGGIMQIQGQDEAGSRDPKVNIMQGARELRGHIDDAKGNVLEAIGSYNGWQRGLTVKTMIHPPWGGASMNLDYVYQIVNGWCQGVDGYNLGNFNKKYNPSFGDQFR